MVWRFAILTTPEFRSAAGPQCRTFVGGRSIQSAPATPRRHVAARGLSSTGPKLGPDESDGSAPGGFRRHGPEFNRAVGGTGGEGAAVWRVSEAENRVTVVVE